MTMGDICTSGETWSWFIQSANCIGLLIKAQHDLSSDYNYYFLPFSFSLW